MRINLARLALRGRRVNEHHAAVAANRFGLGATPGLLKEIQGDPQGWLLSQLAPEQDLPPPLAALPDTGDDLTAFGRWVRQFGRQARSAAGREGNADMAGNGMAAQARQAASDSDVGASFQKGLLPRYLRAAKARFDTAVRSETPFRERLIHFWSNHFVVSAAKPAAIAMPPSFERDVARKHVCGSFLDMLTASSKHPAMTFYLDNYISIGPNSRCGLNPELVTFSAPVIGTPDGLNENLAREILELHTVGVNGGYDQGDVTRFALVITGWNTLTERTGPLRAMYRAARSKMSGSYFNFNEDAHEPGPKIVMGKQYSQEGVEQGEAVLADLSSHPQTARFLATKLVRHFVSDDPPPALVTRVAEAFLETEGDLAHVAGVLVRSPEAWQAPLSKLKRPEEYLVSAARALGAPAITEAELGSTLNQMGQRTYMQPGPDGWPDVGAAWMGPDMLWKRLEWATGTAQKTAGTDVDPAALAMDVLGGVVSTATLREIRRAESPAQGLTLLLASTEFHRR